MGFNIKNFFKKCVSCCNNNNKKQKLCSIKRITLLSSIVVVAVLLYAIILEPIITKQLGKTSSLSSQKAPKVKSSPSKQLTHVLKVANTNPDFKKYYFRKQEDSTGTGMTRQEVESNRKLLSLMMGVFGSSSDSDDRDLDEKRQIIAKQSFLFSPLPSHHQSRKFFEDSIRFFFPPPPSPKKQQSESFAVISYNNRTTPTNTSPSSSSHHHRRKNRKPRIACLISGFLRRFEITLDSCPPEIGCHKGGKLRKRILEPLDCDVFLSTWNERGYGGRSFHDYESAHSKNDDNKRSNNIISGNYISSIFFGGGGGANNNLKGLHLQPFSSSFENLFFKMESAPKYQMNTHNDNNNKDSFFFKQAKPRSVIGRDIYHDHDHVDKNNNNNSKSKRNNNSKSKRNNNNNNKNSFDTPIGLAGNAHWNLDPQVGVEAGFNVMDYKSKRFLRRNDFSQVYKQYCAWMMSLMYEEKKNITTISDDGSDTNNHEYDFFYRMRMDLRSKKELKILSFEEQKKELVFALMEPKEEVDENDVDGEADDRKSDQNNKFENHHRRNLHRINSRRIHVHSNDLSDFIMFAERSVAREMLTSIWEEQLVESVATTLMMKNNDSNINSAGIIMLKPTYVHDTEDEMLLREREIHFDENEREKIRSELVTKLHRDYDQTISPSLLSSSSKFRRMHLKSGTFAEFNLMFWAQIFSHFRQKNNYRRGDGGELINTTATSSNSSLLLWEVDDGQGYIKMDVKKIFMMKSRP